MISVSLCMIVKDEEEVLGRCLESVKNVVDEIIIADTGSKDRQRRLPDNTRTKFMTLNGKMTSQRQGTFHCRKGQRII